MQNNNKFSNYGVLSSTNDVNYTFTFTYSDAPPLKFVATDFNEKPILGEGSIQKIGNKYKFTNATP